MVLNKGWDQKTNLQVGFGQKQQIICSLGQKKLRGGPLWPPPPVLRGLKIMIKCIFRLHFSISGIPLDPVKHESISSGKVIRMKVDINHIGVAVQRAIRCTSLQVIATCLA